MFLLSRCKSSELLLNHPTGEGLQIMKYFTFVVWDTTKTREICLMNILLVQSVSGVRLWYCFKTVFSRPSSTWRYEKKKVVRLVLTHLFSTDKQKFIVIILSKTHVEYTFLKAFVLNSIFKETCCILSLSSLFQSY